MKWRNSKERELLSAGAGSRDVTLPGRDNPHPDLSDALRHHHHHHHEIADGYAGGGSVAAGGFPVGGFPVVTATDLRMRTVDYGARCDDVVVYDVMGSGDKRRCVNAGGARLMTDECASDGEETIHVI